MHIVRSEAEIARVEKWAYEVIDKGISHYPGMSYEQGIVDLLAWLSDDHNPAPDEE
ncbi:MAG: hypothetical protein K2J64_05175 [Desulfovibrio sp.]|nr:hypothetical protein [Desulfovibrio sp.]